MRIAVGQINSTVGDLNGNADKVLFYINEALKKESDLIVFPELAITGHPPEGLLLKPHFIKENLKSLKALSQAIGDIIAIIGFVDKDGPDIYNSAAIIHNKKIVHIYHKRLLCNDGIFDEKIYFKEGDKDVVLKARDFSFGVNIGAEIQAKDKVLDSRIFSNVDFLINLSASRYYFGRIDKRNKEIGCRARAFKMPVIYCNLIGAQDELVFDGRSAIFGRDGKIVSQAMAFEDDLMIVDIPIDSKKKKNKTIKKVDINYKTKIKSLILPKLSIRHLDSKEEIYSALVLGVRDYVKKNNFNKAVLGLSGGIDSALATAIAVDALGKENVLAISMPSKYSSAQTQKDAELIARNLGMRFIKVPIDDIFDAYNRMLLIHFEGMKTDITEENLQARIRCNILMAFSNKFGYLVLNTGNKSETSVGYCTLYGDMGGGFSVIKDVSKKLVYELAEHRNAKAGKEIIPNSVFKRAPSAELRPNQTDQDLLPPYGLLDKVIDLYMQENKGFNDIVKKVKDRDNVKKVLKMIDMSEYKRRQAPPGVRITRGSFGKDRRMPITNKFSV